MSFLDWRRTLSISRKEIRHVRRDPFTLALALGLPVLLVTFFGFAIDFERASAALVIEPGFGRDAGADRGASAQLILDGADNTRASAMLGYLPGITAAAQARLLGSAPPRPAHLRTRFLYNPELNSRCFVIPGLTVVVVGLLAILLTALTVAREWENGSMELLLSTPVHPLEIILGKLLPYILLGLVDAALVIAAGVLIFSVPLRGPLWILALSAFVFIVTTVSVGTLISTIADSQQQAMLGGFLFLFPAIAWVAHLDPLMYFVRLLRNVLLKGGGPRLQAVPADAQLRPY